MALQVTDGRNGHASVHCRVAAGVGIALFLLALFARIAPADDSALPQLEKRVTLEQGVEANTPLKVALRMPSERAGVKIDVDGDAFAKELQIPHIQEQVVRLPRLNCVQLAAVLRVLLPQVHASYTVREGHVVIRPARENELPPEPKNADRTKAESELIQGLTQRITLDEGIEETVVRDALELLAKRFDVNLASDLTELPVPGPVLVQLENVLPVKLAPVRDLPLGSALQELVLPIRCTWAIHDNLVLIVPRNKVPAGGADEDEVVRGPDKT